MAHLEGWIEEGFQVPMRKDEAHMTRDQAQQLWPVIKAWCEGEVVQVATLNEVIIPWKDYRPGDLDAYPAFENLDLKWRVKPKPRSFWVVLDRESGNPIGCVTTNPGLAPNIVHVTETP